MTPNTTPPMPRTRRGWKQYEENVAAAVGARRIPVTGRTGPGEDPGDIDLPGFYVEVRDRTRARPLRWMVEAWEAARPRGTKPLVVFRGPAPHLSPLVILRWRDLAEVIKRAGYTGVDRPAAPGPSREPFQPEVPDGS